MHPEHATHTITRNTPHHQKPPSIEIHPKLPNAGLSGGDENLQVLYDNNTFPAN
ncbi:MAG: hypothetical protein ACTSU9_04560 [Promethearchaeota archaeon]